MIWKLVRRHRQRLDWLGLAVAIAVFGLWPEIDLWVSGWFHESVRGWFQTDAHWTQALYRGTDGLAVAVSACVLLTFAFAWCLPLRGAGRAHRKASFLLLAYLLGPVLLVNEGFKEYWGRARPKQVEVFDGSKPFTSALQPADHCQTNCSFVSGHASVGFALTALAWISRRPNVWVAVGLILGSAIGLSRIAMGGHFLSDIVFSGLVVWFSVRGAAWLFVRRRPACRLAIKSVRGLRTSRKQPLEASA
ncbi:MAG: phosphatase PAP2 family protein [Panacagrimonas sp.]